MIVAVLELANSVAPRARPSNSTSTPRRRDGFRSSVCSVHSFCASCGRFCPYVLPATAGVSCCLYYSVSVGRHSCVSPVFVRGRRVDLLLLSWQSLLHGSFAFALFFHLRYRSAGGGANRLANLP